MYKICYFRTYATAAKFDLPAIPASVNYLRNAPLLNKVGIASINLNRRWQTGHPDDHRDNEEIGQSRFARRRCVSPLFI